MPSKPTAPKKDKPLATPAAKASDARELSDDDLKAVSGGLGSFSAAIDAAAPKCVSQF